MFKKLCALFLTLSVISAFFVPVTQAASPLVFSGSETVLFDETFDGEAISEFTDFTFNNNSTSGWVCGYGYVMISGSSRNASIKTKNTYSLTDAESAEFKITCVAKSNGYSITAGGYKIRWDHTTKKAYLYGPDQSDTATDWKTANLDTASLAVYDAITTWTISAKGNVLTVSTDAKGEIMSYTAEEKIDLSGNFGITGNYTTNLAVFDMLLSKTDSDITLNQWRYETNFKSTDTVDKYKAEGLTLPSATDFANGYVKPGSNSSYTLSPASQKISGDYGIEYKFKPQNQNAYYLRFNYIDSNNYYEIYHYRKAISANPTDYPATAGLIVRKKTADGYTVLKMIDVADTYFASSNVPYLYTIKVKNVTEGLDISVNIDRTDTTKDTPIDFTVTDSSKFTEAGTVRGVNSYTGASSILYYLNAYSLVASEDVQTVTYAETVVDKSEFLNSDLAGLAELNMSAGSYAAKNSGESLTFTDSTSRLFNMYYNDTLSGAYDFETTMKRDNNDGYVDFNINSKNYYRLHFKGNKSPYTISLQKSVNDTLTAFTEETATYTGVYEDIGRSSAVDVKVSVRPDEAGNVAITAVVNVNGKTINLSATDTQAAPLADVAPYTSGTIRIRQGYCKNASVSEFGVTKYVTETDVSSDGVPAYVGRFYNDSGAIKEISSGTVYFDYPTARLGNYTVAAALYENHEMTGFKLLEPTDLYGTKAELFDVTDAQNASVKVFFFDAQDSMNKLTQVYELN